jgi:NADPH-dependent 2,4-dienoyl-CoA reductase/sulfur reductase-like enzyme
LANYQYLIIGGGMASAAAVKGIRKNDAHGSIGILSMEPVPPYNRPPLSKGLWKGKALDTIWRDLSDQAVDLHLSHPVVQLNIAQRTANTANGKQFGFQKLLLATGGLPKRLPFQNENILYYRTLADYQALRERALKGSRMVVVGGGFIGAELAAALIEQGCQTSLILPGDGISARLFPPDMARFLIDYYRRKGVNIYSRERIIAVDRQPKGTQVTMHSGKKLWADTVVIGIGISPATEVASAAGIKVDPQSPGGILVDNNLRTNALSVYAAGDVASIFNPVLGQRMRSEHEDNALVMGDFAGRNMSGEPIRYDYLPYFYSDLFDLGYEAVGEINPTLETYADWQDPFYKGVIYYLRNQRVRGVLLWNIWNQVPAARALIGEPGPFTPFALKGRLPVSVQE